MGKSLSALFIIILMGTFLIGYTIQQTIKNDWLLVGHEALDVSVDFEGNIWYIDSKNHI